MGGRRVALRGCDDDLLFQGCPAPFALLLHLLLESGGVHRQAALGREQLGHVQGEAVSVVELESVPARKLSGRACNGRTAGEQLVEDLEAAVQRPAEAFLLAPDHAADEVLPLDEFRKDGAQRFHDRRDQLLEKAGRQAELLPVQDAPAEDAPDHIVAALVSRQGHPVREEARPADRLFPAARPAGRGIAGRRLS